MIVAQAASVQEGSANGLQAPNGTVADVASIAAGSYAAPEPLQHEVHTSLFQLRAAALHSLQVLVLCSWLMILHTQKAIFMENG